MINVTVAKEEVRTPKQYESNRYRIEITQDCDDPNKVENIVSKTFTLIRQQIEEQKKLDQPKTEEKQ